MSGTLIVFLSAICVGMLAGVVMGYMRGYRHGWDERSRVLVHSKKHEKILKEIQSQLETM